MSEEEPWIIREEESRVYSDPANKWVTLFFDQVRFRDGTRGRYNRLVEGRTGEGVILIARQPAGAICFVRAYRYPVQSWQWELPRGYVEPGQSLEENARRELAEETSLEAGRLTNLGMIFPDSGLLTTRAHVFLAEVLSPSSTPPDAAEAIREVKFWSPDEYEAMISKSTIQDGLTLAALRVAGM